MLELSFNSEYSDERFQKEIAEPLEKKFPHIKLQYRREDPRIDNNVDKWNSTGDTPDIHLLVSHSLYKLIKCGLCIDLRELNNGAVDSQHFEVGLLSYGYGDKGEIFSFPYSNAMEYPLFYNKDIFDRFDIPYPNDGMTWNKVIELAHNVTGEINGVHYIGLDITDHALMRSQLSASILDPQTGRASMNNEKWKKIAQTIKRIYEIKGNFLPERNKTLRLNRFFVRDKIVAMGVVCPSCYNHSELDFNWDMVSYPAYEELYGPNLWNSLSLAISPSCKNKNTALEIISYLVSDEFQRNNCRNGILTSLNKREVQQHFGENLSIYQNKNVQSLFFNRPAMPEPRCPVKVMDLLYEIHGKINPRWKFVDMVYDNKGVDETLQELEFDINKAIHDALPQTAL